MENDDKKDLNLMNRLHNCTNHYQGKYKRVLCVCSAGLLRSPTAAWVLSNEPYNFNTRACGSDGSYALFPLDIVHLTWADQIVCMSKEQEAKVTEMLKNVFQGESKEVVCLNIPDKFSYRDPELVEMIKKAYNDV